MKILFINPTLGADYSALDIAITEIATYINSQTKHTAEICDLTFHRRHWVKHIYKYLDVFQPDICGISANTLYMRYNKMITNAIKQKYDIPIIYGGYHASIHPEETLKEYNIDYLCIGDGEHLTRDLLDSLENKEKYPNLPGLGIKKNKKIIINAGGSFIEDMNSLPIPDWDLWKDLDKYFYFLGMLYVIGSRGCPYKCSYCDAQQIDDSVNGKYYRIIDPIKYANNLKIYYDKYKSRNLRLFQMFDQVLTLDEKWLEQFCSEYIRLELNTKIRWSSFSRIDNLDKDKIKMLSEANCALLRVGIESGNDFIRNKIYKKHISTEKIKEIFGLCKQNNIGFTAFYMLGGPAETPETVNDTIQLARELDANRSAFFIFKPFTKEGWDLVEEYGGFVNKNLWDSVDNITFGATIENPELKPKQVEFLQKKAYFFTFGKRLIRMLFRLKLKYPIQLFTYVLKGLFYGMGLNYLVTYYHIYGYDNVDK